MTDHAGVALSAEVVASLDAARHQRTASRDAWLAALFDAAVAGNSAGLALVAVGGYGRRELGPGSDLDVVLLHTGRDDVERIAERIWYPIWDAGQRLDHAVRTISETLAVAASDLRVLLGLLHARTLRGDPALVPTVREQVLRRWRADAPTRLPALAAMCAERAERYGDVAFLIEPDLKEARGGLRDVDALEAIAAAWVAAGPGPAARAAYRQLLAIRDVLQEVTGRPTTRLVVQEQSAVAERLGLAGSDELLRVVAAAGRTIAYAMDATWRAVNGSLRRRPRSPRRPLADGVVEQDGEVVLARGADPRTDPTLLVRAAAAAAQADLPLAPPTIATLAAHTPPLPTPWPAQARDAFVALLGAGRPALHVIEGLDQAGVWSRLLSEWQAVRYQRQRHPLHRFTVDRHLVETVIEAAALTRRVARPDLLLVGALLHDIGKGFIGGPDGPGEAAWSGARRSGDDHAERGAAVARTICARMGFSAADTEAVATMVRLHLLLPQTALRRDLDDPATITSVAEQVGSAALLDLLYALAEADSRATGVWDTWRARLVGELVRRVRASLAGQAPQRPTVEIPAAVRAAVERGQLAVVADGGRLIVVAPDQPGLLWRSAGVLALHRLGVRAARATSIDSTAVTVFDVEPEYLAEIDPDRLREDLRRALDGSLDLSAALARRSAGAAQRQPAAPPPVVLLPAASADATVFEVRAHDRPGLLFTIARILSDHGLDVRLAQVETLGADAVDVFYVTDTAGKPLSEAAAEEVRRALETALLDGRR